MDAPSTALVTFNPVRKIPLLAVTLLLSPAVCAHVGSPNTFFEGSAGPYRLFVTVRMPEVIPGVAEVGIRSKSADVTAIRMRPLRLSGAGSEFAPKPEFMERSTNDPQFFSGRIWLMEFHALQLRIEAEGDRGEGLLAVPLMAEAQRTLRMDRPLGSLLFAFMIFLAVGFVLILRVALGEARLEPGAASTPSATKLRWITGVGVLLVIAILYLGNSWWNAEANAYSLRVMRPPIFRALVDPAGRLSLFPPEGQSPVRARAPRPSGWLTWPEVLKNLRPDHGHLMHLFLIRLPAWDYFCHLHPEGDPNGFFSQNLPHLPSGRYQMFADVVTETGLAITMVGQVDLPELSGLPLRGDDSTTGAPPNPVTAGTQALSVLQDGQMEWERDPGPLRAGTALRLRFQVEDRGGQPALDLQPYMGMAGHLIILRSDGTVFAHVHPAGSVTMALLELAGKSLPSTMEDMAPMHTQPLSSEVAFPYGFPQPGEYRLFVQVKRKNQIQTGIFDARVEP
jgi:hypothetical protein